MQCSQRNTFITRINGSLLSQFIGSMVSIVGTVESVNGAMVTLRTSVCAISSLFLLDRMINQLL